MTSSCNQMSGNLIEKSYFPDRYQMDRKRFAGRFVGALVVLLIIEVTLLCLHLGWGGFHRPLTDHKTVLAGHVVKNENELRRRGTNSLVWEKSYSDDSVYYYDSILTLSQSTASLKLFKDTEIHLSENTLVTIEPQDDKSYGEIRLKFVKGSFQARNPFSNAKVESDTWSMEIKTGTEVDFRQVGENEFEFGVKKGEVDFTSALGQDKVAENQMLRIRNDAPVKMQVEQGLNWSDPPQKRIYTHGLDVPVLLKWKSREAKEIILQTLGDKEVIWTVDENQTRREIRLPLGRHQLFLRSGNRTSSALEVEVWKAPLLHLLSPLPRNRIKTEVPTAFLWMMAPGVSSYAISFHGQNQNIEKTSLENSYSATFGEEDDVLWSVEGLDADGFVIPPLYNYPLYIRETPLSAPKLKTPFLRRPAKVEDSGASFRWFDLLLPRAQADEIAYQAIFSWEPVDGADRYVIEISESADFRAPSVTKTVLKNEFTWKNVLLKTYYWRVAAETKKGRMGIFSDPQEINLREGLSAPGVEVSPLADPRPEPPPAKTGKTPIVHFGSETPAPPPPQDKPLNVLEPTPQPVHKLEFRPHSFIEWSPIYSSISATGVEDMRAHLNGQSLTSVRMGTERSLAVERMVRVQVDYTRQNFMPQPKEKYPLQENLQWPEVSALVVFHMNSSHLGYGVYVVHSADIVRESLETVKTNPTNIVGPCMEGLWQMGHAQYIGDYMALVGSQYGVLTKQNIRTPLWPESPLFLGGGFSAEALFQSGGHTYSLTGQATLGFDF